MAEDGFVYMKERRLPYPTFDADNHMYENKDALTKFIPKEFDGVIKYVEINGRTKVAIKDKLSDYIPNPTFNVVAVPGGYGREKGRSAPQQGKKTDTRGEKPRIMPSVDAFFDPEPRLELMKDMGIDRALMWPTLASVVEERLSDDPDAACAVVHALNEWMYEHWTYNYSDAIFATPIISLARMDKAIEELQRVHERGARAFLLRVAPVPTYTGRKSFALPQFDPFWELVSELDIVVGMHSGDSGYQRYINDWEGLGDREFRAFVGNGAPGFLALMSEKSNLVDAMASILGHGVAQPLPHIEVRAGRVRELLDPAVRREAAAGQREAVGAVRRGPVRSVQAQRLGAHLPRPRPGESPRDPAGRPPHVRVRLPAPRGHGRPARLLRGRREPSDRDAGAHHGRLARQDHEGGRLTIRALAAAQDTCAAAVRS